MVHPRGRNKAIAVIEAYCDESGIHSGAPSCVVAGFVASAREWQIFEERWRKTSGGVDFHGKRFFARDEMGQRVSPYKGWSDEKAQGYLLGLAAIITSRRLTPIGAVVDVKAFQALSLADRKYLTGAPFNPHRGKFTTSGAPSKPYFMAFTHCVVDAVYCVRKAGWKVTFVFDRQRAFAPYATLYYQRALAQAIPEIRKRLGELSFKDKTGVAGLQAADLLTNACYRRREVNLRGASNRKIDMELNMLTERLAPMVHNKIVLYDEVAMQDYLSEVPEHVRRVWNC